jgi:hypothetical protein
MIHVDCQPHLAYRILCYKNLQQWAYTKFIKLLPTFAVSQSGSFSIYIIIWSKVQQIHLSATLMQFTIPVTYSLSCPTHLAHQLSERLHLKQKNTDTSIVYTLQGAVQLVRCSVIERLPKLWQRRVQPQARKKNTHQNNRFSSIGLKVKR